MNAAPSLWKPRSGNISSAWSGPPANIKRFASGPAPRATQALYRASQALAAINGRNYVIPDDIKQLAASVLAHRLILNSETRLRGKGKENLILEILEQVKVPLD